MSKKKKAKLRKGEIHLKKKKLSFLILINLLKILKKMPHVMKLNIMMSSLNREMKIMMKRRVMVISKSKKSQKKIIMKITNMKMIVIGHKKNIRIRIKIKSQNNNQNKNM